MKIIYFSSVKYPTDKAYAVTIYYSMQALTELGHETKIMAPNNFSNSKDFKLLNFLQKNYILILDRIILHTKNKFIFLVKRFSIALIAKRRIPKDTDLLWIRDPLIGIFNQNKTENRKIVIEVHQRLSWFDTKVLKKIFINKNVIIAPISIELTTKLLDFGFDKSRIVMSPMAVPNVFFSSKYDIDSIDLSNRQINLGYIGGAFSLGIDQNLPLLINCVKKFNFYLKNADIKFQIFGIDSDVLDSEIIDLQRLINSKIISFHGRMSHVDLLSNISKCNVFILPYPENEFFAVRFPIKALEYASLRRPILITNTTSHRNIFNDDEVWFYESDNCDNLFLKLLEIIENPELVREKVRNAYHKSLNFTYQNRVEIILKKLE